MKRKKPLAKIQNYIEPVVSTLSPGEMEGFKSWVEEFTGGPNKCQVPRGGVCIRPDIILHQNCCNACPYHQFCLCKSKYIG